jgi:hypothetical protein
VEVYKESQPVYSKRVKAGKRTYFFDVKETRNSDYYLVITEIKRQYADEGLLQKKHKIFLYKEDLNKFMESLHTTAEYIKKELLPNYDFDKFKDHAGETNSFGEGSYLDE